MEEMLFIATLFVTRIVLPIAATLLVGAWIERTLRRGAHS
jgi:hypothetical protein